jgi:hypothetical protein
MPARKRKSRSRTRPRKYTVHAELSNFRLARARSALRLQVYARGVKVGQLEVGSGSLYWSGAHRQSSKRIPWGRFAEMMDKLAYGSHTSA